MTEFLTFDFVLVGFWFLIGCLLLGLRARVIRLEGGVAELRSQHRHFPMRDEPRGGGYRDAADREDEPEEPPVHPTARPCPCCGHKNGYHNYSGCNIEGCVCKVKR